MLVFKSKYWYLFGIVLLGFVMQKVLPNYLREIDYVQPEIAEEARMTTIELVEKYGYKTETHFVQTKDGYILQLHRIVRSPIFGGTPTKVIFAMHGLPSSSADFTVFGPNISLAYVFADNGYDVWMGNARGNRYSRNHTTLSTDDTKFWKFSWHEIGVYDLPASIDYVLGKTNRSSLSYIGFSQGTVAFFVMCSERPEYMDKVNHMHALSPIAFMNRTNSQLLRLAGLYALYFDPVYKIKGNYEYLPNTAFIRGLGEMLCNDKTRLNVICTTVLFELCGYDVAQLNITKLPVFVGHIPAGSSNMNIMHFGQLMQSGLFRKFDHGPKENLVKYGTIAPPEYNLTRITVPIALHYSNNDRISHPDDILKLKNALPNVIGLFQPKWKYFNHVDYLIAKEANIYMHPTILSILKIYS